MSGHDDERLASTNLSTVEQGASRSLWAVVDALGVVNVAAVPACG
ncbi:hypothetical protein RAJCM14343_3206 [Rhodococcus aetherivorans]|uniref:Uncharacterized protein n=1 Tax=Rhodococcus aetherivorans TaxID=191292 RepID=A0ABQ0YMZ7_9NOCA|nr:hypothetical protein [Rhodococcus aetherivorans]GES37946.1 hypothetical protein RAJCM14343_3206 [Rhodococcus aetherivorans]